jgi:hypothetical protein
MHFTGALQPRGKSLDGDYFQSGISAGLTKQHAAELVAVVLPVFYPKGGMFFLEGQVATGGLSSTYWPGQRVYGFE